MKVATFLQVNSAATWQLIA